MNCAETLRSMRGMLEGTAAAEVVAAAEAHIGGCGECARVWAVARESTCRDVAEFLRSYVDGDLEPAQRAVFERHVALCGECVTYMETYRGCVDLCREAAAECPPPLPDGLLAAILAARSAGGGGRPREP